MFGILSILIVSTLGIGVVLKLTTETSNISRDNVYAISEDLAEQIRTMQQDIASLKERNEKLEQKLRDLRDENDKSQSLFEDNHVQHHLSNGSRVAFCAALSVLSLNVSVGAHVVFDQVEINIGQAYNPATGVFTCPITGKYYFAHSALASFVGGWLETEIMLDGMPKALIYCGDRRSFQNLTDYDQGANSVVIRCNKGQRVWVQIYNNNGSVLFNQRYTQFSGFLLW